MRNVVKLIIIAAALAVPAQARAAVSDASSGPGFGTTYVLRGAKGHSVEYRDNHRRRHRFTIPGTPVAIHLAQLEHGGGLVAWDQGDKVYVRTWTRRGGLAPAQAVLTGVATQDRSLEGSPVLWSMSADRTGTVAIAAASSGLDRIYAAVRDPGGPFGAQQAMVSGLTDGFMEHTWVSAIAADGTLSIDWGRDGVLPRNALGRATRSARATTFGAPETLPGDNSTEVVPGQPDVFAADDSQLVRIGPALRAFSGGIGTRPHLFKWSKTNQVLVFRYRSVSRWYQAKREADGSFDDPQRIKGAAGAPVWTSEPGVVEFRR